MVKKIVKIIVALFLVLVSIYLLLPSPSEPPPLPQSLKSTEPGDTVEIPGLFAYYTNLSRQEAVSFYEKSYRHSRLWGIPLINYRLNHPPEFVKEVIRDTVHSSYLEEIVYPLRESFYINGYEPANDPFVEPAFRRSHFEVQGQQFKAKVTVLHKQSNPLIRVFVFWGIILALWFLWRQFKTIYGSFRHHC